MTTLKIPIFIIVHDRVKVLKKTVASFESQIASPIEIIFHDVASTFPGCLKYLQDMKENGYTVYRSEKNHHHTVFQSINKYLVKHPKCQYYVVTDPDIERRRSEFIKLRKAITKELDAKNADVAVIEEELDED